MKYFIVAGEASGDLHGANLAKAIFDFDEKAEIVGWGGEKMSSAGVDVQKHYNQLAIMGFIEVLYKLPVILNNLSNGAQFVKEFQPDAVILIDFSGFNLRLAKKLRKKGYQGKIFYYISPKLWAWNSGRVKSFRKYIDAVYCILPFEVDFYKLNSYNNAHYIGNPLMDEIKKFQPNENFLAENNLSEQALVALLPGSREKEVELILPEMLAMVNEFPNYQFVIAGVESVKENIEKALSIQKTDVPVIYNNTYNLIHHAKAAVVTSGTATLETALLNTPLVLCYKGSTISFGIAKMMVNIEYIGLPNLIMNKEMVKELVQSNCSKEELKKELSALLESEKKRKQFFSHQKELRKRVGEAGASTKAAQLMIRNLTAREHKVKN